MPDCFWDMVSVGRGPTLPDGQAQPCHGAGRRDGLPVGPGIHLSCWPSRFSSVLLLWYVTQAQRWVSVGAGVGIHARLTV